MLKKLEFYVPDSYRDAVCQALFDAGAGRIGHYDSCCWFTQGTGQFRPLDGSRPFLGQQGEVHQEPETKVELVFDNQFREGILAALKAAHPYETPAYQIFQGEV